MPVDIDQKLTQQIADLARLELSAQELETFTSQLSQVVNYITQLQEVNVESTAPLTHPFEPETPLRADQVTPPPRDSQGKPKVLQSAPELFEDGFKVPQVI